MLVMLGPGGPSVKRGIDIEFTWEKSDISGLVDACVANGYSDASHDM